MSMSTLTTAFVLRTASAMQVGVQRHQQEASLIVDVGNPACPCVGVSGLSGYTTVSIGGEKKPGFYPTDIGSNCRAWDAGVSPGSCDGENPASWCLQNWCYVDPCNCDIGTNPSTSSYLAGATYEGKQIFYSYATCGGTNTYNTPPASPQMQEACSKSWDAATFGLEDCPCVGIDDVTGFTDVVIGGILSGVYPAELGSHCDAWDADRYPESCTGDNKADWCVQKWCYVKKSSCKLPEGANGPYPSGYLPAGKFQGEPLYYSYVTCQGTNTYDSL